MNENKYRILLQEDDCAPDARQTFLNEFKNMFGTSFEDWKKEAVNISKYEDTIRYMKDNIYAVSSADDQTWKIFKTD
jgi:hypothetical protein